MNNTRRGKLREAAKLLDGVSDIISSVQYEESDCLGNMPENLQTSEKCEVMENALDCLDDALSSIEDAKNSINEAMGG